VNAATLEELLANVLRDAGWIMAGGSAQFREGALSELQSSLRVIRQHPINLDILHAAKTLSEKAAQVAANNASDTASVMDLRRVLAEFEQAMRAYLATAKNRRG
jgi:hypothetical protein